MKIIYKFNDGSQFPGYVTEREQGDFLSTLKAGKEKDSDVKMQTPEGPVNRTFAEMVSVEIIL